RVDGWAGIADRFDVELPELAVAAGLRPVVSEHPAGERQLYGLRPGLHPVLDVRSGDPRGRLRPQRPRLAVLGRRGEPEQLLLDDVGHLADAALEDRGLLEQWRLDRAVAVARSKVRGDPFQARKRNAIRRKQVAGASRSAEGRHRPRS